MAVRFVVDKSVVMAWCFKDESDPYADRVLESLSTSSALTPAIWPLEVVNVLLAAERKNRLVEGRMGGLLPVAREYGLSSYDAPYLHLAMRNGLALATRDEKLKVAAKKAKVALWVPK